ncbi:MAG: VWA domain-containing protein [Blastocatellia bacterium]|nr:VWA domain-containing protein [Blastocatellia bacterium]
MKSGNIITYLLCGLAVWLAVPFSSVAAQSVPVPPEVKGPVKKDKTGAVQDDKNDIRVRSDLVTVAATVLRKNDEPVSRLERDDFEIYEDGKLQKIEAFSHEENNPLRLVMLLDTSSSVRNRLKFEQEAAVRFFREVLRPIDRAAFYSFNHDIVLRQDMTSDTTALESSTKGLEARGGTAIFDAIFVAAQRVGREKGRRVIVIVSDGSNTISKVTLARALEEVRKSEAVVYGVYAAAKTRYDDFLQDTSQSTLETLARETGGRVFRTESAELLATQFAQLTAELKAQYNLAYYSTNDSHDGKYRKIEVRVKRPDLQVRARDGYIAPKD